MECVRSCWCVWLDKDEKIASFHVEEGFYVQNFDDFDRFQAYIWMLQHSGYRFQ